MTEKVLITGGLGYLGGRIVQSIAESGRYSLRIGSKRLSQEQLPAWLKNQEIVPLDMLADDSLEAACAGVSHVIHLAALNEIECAKHPDTALLVNGFGTLRLADIAARQGIKRFIYMSTAHIYAAPLAGKINEMTPPRPRHPYAISKLAGENFLLAQGGLESVVIRLSNGFGKPVHPDINRWGLVVNDFCRQAVSSGRIVIKSSGRQYRDFVSFGDVTAAVLHLLILPNNQLHDGIFNLGGGQSLTIKLMAELVAARCRLVLGLTPDIVVEAATDEKPVEMLEYSTTKISRTGFIPSSSLEDEIDDLLLFCKEKFR